MITRPDASRLPFSLSLIEKKKFCDEIGNPSRSLQPIMRRARLPGGPLHPWASANGFVLHEIEDAGVGSARVDEGRCEPRPPGFQAGGTVATLTADLMKTSVHFVAIGFLSCFLAADVLLESGRRTREARIPRLDKGANR